MSGTTFRGALVPRAVSLASFVGQETDVLGELRLADTPRRVCAALAYAPALAVWKVGLQFTIAACGGREDSVATRADRQAGGR